MIDGVADPTIFATQEPALVSLLCDLSALMIDSLGHIHPVILAAARVCGCHIQGLDYWMCANRAKWVRRRLRG